MTVRKKILSGFAVMIVLILLLGTVMSIKLNSIGNHAKEIRNDSIPSLVALYSINDKVTDIENLVLRSIVAQGDEEMQQINADIESQKAIMTASMTEYEQYLSDEEEQQWYESFKKDWASYEVVMVEIIKASDINDDIRAMQMQQDETPRLKSIDTTLDKLVARNTDDVNNSADNQLNDFYSSRLFIWISVGIAVLIGVGVALLISATIVRPLKRMLEQVNYIAAGDLTRTASLSVKQKDELGDLAQGLQQMGVSLHTVITEVNDNVKRLNGSAEELTAIAEENAAVFSYTAESLVSMADVSAEQAKQSEQGAVRVKDISANIQGIDQRINKVSESAQTAAENSASGSVIVAEAAQQMESAQTQMNEMSAVVNELESRSQEIGSIVGIITGIAGQTNLLALNAAIEAARAGEHGKGFAVVASEVQKLAEQSSSSAGRIVQMVASIQEDTDRLQQSMNLTTQQISSGAASMRSTGVLFGDIQHSVNEVAAQSEEAAAVSGSVSQSTEQMEQSITGIVQSVEQTSEEIQKVSASSEQQSASMGELSSSAMALSDMAEEMSRIVERFKL